MSTTKKFLYVSGLTLIALVPAIPTTHAAGFYSPAQSTSAQGTSLAGAASEVRDASIIYYNPAGMTHLTGPEFYGSANVTVAKRNLEDTGSTLLGGAITGTDSDNPVPTTVIPSFFMAYPVKENLWLGLGLTSPFGMSQKYDSDWFGRYDSIKSKLLTVDVQPSFAYEISDRISIGGGLNIRYADGELTQAVTDGASFGTSKLKGDDWATGFNIGALGKITDQTTLGIHYRSAMVEHLDGNIVTTDTATLNENSGASAKVKLPETVFIGLSHDLTERLTLLAEADWIGFGSFSKLVAVRDNGTVASTVEQGNRNTWTFSGGVDYKWDDSNTVRFGYSYEQTPTTSGLRSTQLPDGNRNILSAGLSHNFSDKLRLDVTGTYIMIADSNVDVSRNAGLAQVSAEAKDGHAFVFATGLKYGF